MSVPACQHPASPALLPLFLGEGLAPHGHVLLVLHQPQQGRAGLDAQAIVVILGVAPGREAEGEGWAGGGTPIIHWELYIAPTSSLLGSQTEPRGVTHVPHSSECWAGEAMGAMGARRGPHLQTELCEDRTKSGAGT